MGVQTQHSLPTRHAQSASPSAEPAVTGGDSGREGWSVECLQLQSKESIPYATGSLRSRKHFFLSFLNGTACLFLLLYKHKEEEINTQVFW